MNIELISDRNISKFDKKMFLFSLKLRRILAISLLSITLFFGSAVKISNSNIALAQSPTRDSVDMTDQDTPSKAEYEAEKANRRQMQAQMSKQADTENETANPVDKLNLKEIQVPPAVKDLGTD